MDKYSFQENFSQLLRNDPKNMRKKQLLKISNRLGLSSIIFSYPFIVVLILFGNGNGLTDQQSLLCAAAALASSPLWIAAGVKQIEWKAL